MTAPEPIAIVGMACRFAGGIGSPAEYWTFLRQGEDAIGPLPEGRWDWYAGQSAEHAAVVRNVPKHGAFLDDIAGFDADFFGITPREAAVMDPQQRIVLELSWEALEHAGLRPADLDGSDTGVFIGVGADDYGRRLLEDLPRIEAWTGIGSSYCAVANRVSYSLNLRGPSMALDTACSSSLVAVHLAAQALRAGECPVALAGGVLVMAAPGLSVVLDAAGATARDGRSKSFDAAADGYGRGEGGGVVVLKRLRDARSDGDRVLAVLRGSAVHQDGRTAGIMAPSGRAQAHLLRRAYARAGIDPASVDYVEAHGTGTSVGDPLEATAMAEVFGDGRPPGRPCLIGSAKPNIGHLEAAAGVAGLIKTVLALRHREIPASLNVTVPNPAVDWDHAGLRVVTAHRPWPDNDAPRRAGVSGYGYGGTIAHLIVEEAAEPTGDSGAAGVSGIGLFPLSGHSAESVTRYAGILADELAARPSGPAGPPPLHDIGHTLALRRAHLPHRAAVVAAGRDELVTRLRELANGGRDGRQRTALPGARAGTVWVFSGHGSQWAGMARDLAATHPAFREVLDELEPVFRTELGESLHDLLRTDGTAPVHIVQPLIYAVQVALAATWTALGHRPAAVIGHSVGEIAAAVTAGVMDRRTGAALVCRRSLLLAEVAGRGAMAMADVAPEEAAAQLADRDDVVVAILPAPGWTVVSGTPDAVRAVGDQWRSAGRTVLAINTDVAFHSPQMDPLLDRLAAAAADLPFGEPELPTYCTALEDPRSSTPRDGHYWAANLREPVRLSSAVVAAAEDGYRLFLEISPHPVVAHSLAETLHALDIGATHVGHTLRRGTPGLPVMLTSLAELYCHGATVDWAALWPHGSVADLPPRAWQHTHHWAPEPEPPALHTTLHDPAAHTLLGHRTVVHGDPPAELWTTVLDRSCRPYPGDHPVQGVEIVPAAVLLTTFLTAAATHRSWAELHDVQLRVPVSVSTPREIQVVLHQGALRLASRPAEQAVNDQAWLTHTTATVSPAADEGDPTGQWGMPAGTGMALPPDYPVQRLASVGVAAMGFSWSVSDLRRGEHGMTVRLQAGTGADGWAPLLDAVLSVASTAFPDPPILRMPAHLDLVHLDPAPPAAVCAAMLLTGEDTVDVTLTDDDGHRVGVLTGLRYGTLDPAEHGAGAGAGAGHGGTDRQALLHELGWTDHPGDGAPAPAAVTVITSRSPRAAQVIAALTAVGVSCVAAAEPADLVPSDLADGRIVLLVPPEPVPADLAGSVTAAAWSLTEAAQRLVTARSGARLCCLTRGARECADDTGLVGRALWGLGRIIGGEHPEIWGGAVDAPAGHLDAERLAGVLASAGDGEGRRTTEDVVSIAGGRAQVLRLRSAAGPPGRPLTICRADATYLITGGLGALGLAVAHRLVDRGARRLILLGRTGLPARARWDSVTDHAALARIRAVRGLERRGVTVVVTAADIADLDGTRLALVASAGSLPPVRGIVHAAGVLDNRTVRDLDRDSLAGVLRPKVAGALVLDQLFPAGSVDFFVLFSSVGQLLGLAGQASYAAGNAFLDGLAARRRLAHDAGTTSMLWTSWRGQGMSTSSAVIDAELAAVGTADITQEQAFAAWDLAERYGLSHPVVLRLLPPGSSVHCPPVLSELSRHGPATAGGGHPAGAGGPGDGPHWADLDPAGLERHLRQAICRRVAGETGLPETDVDHRRPLLEMGLDSLMTTRIRHGLEREFQIRLPATLLWDKPTVEAIASFLAQRLTDRPPPPTGAGPALAGTGEVAP